MSKCSYVNYIIVHAQQLVNSREKNKYGFRFFRAGLHKNGLREPSDYKFRGSFTVKTVF